MSQLGRIEFAMYGGRCNTDFIDNAAGVDCSDHEVNIKILLADVMRSQKHNMTIKSRNTLLESMTDDVAHKVLSNNYQQAQAISLAEFHAPDKIQEQEEFMLHLERTKGIKRDLEGLPDTVEVKKRAQDGKGLTRPELAVLLSHAKTTFTQNLLQSDLPDQKFMQGWALRYFPEVLGKKYEAEILRHRLKREIVSTRIASSIVNRMGPTFLKEVAEKTGEDDASIVKAYILILEMFNLRDLWAGIEALDNKVPATVQLRAMSELAKLIQHTMTWLLIAYKGVNFSVKDLKRYTDTINDLRKNWGSVITKTQKQDSKTLAQQWKSDGFPDDLAGKMSYIPVLISACDIARISFTYKNDLYDTAKTYFQLGELFQLDWLRKKAKYITTRNQWQDEAKDVMIDAFFDCQATLAVKVLQSVKVETLEKKQTIVGSWQDINQSSLTKFDALMEKLQGEGSLDFAMLMIAEQQIRNLCHV